MSSFEIRDRTAGVMRDATYHLTELQIAQSEHDPRRCFPNISPDALRILDIGCGAGQTLITMKTKPDAHLFGVDVDLQALKLGTKIGSQIHFTGASGEALPFEAEYFDAVVSRVSLPYMQINMALSEINRVLRPGGELWVTLHPLRMTLRELFASFFPPKLKNACFRSFIILNGVIFGLAGWQLHFPFGRQSCQCFQTVRGIKRALRRAGFDSISVEINRHFIATAKKRASVSLEVRPPRGAQAELGRTHV